MMTLYLGSASSLDHYFPEMPLTHCLFIDHICVYMRVILVYIYNEDRYFGIKRLFYCQQIVLVIINYSSFRLEASKSTDAFQSRDLQSTQCHSCSVFTENGLTLTTGSSIGFMVLNLSNLSLVLSWTLSWTLSLFHSDTPIMGGKGKKTKSATPAPVRKRTEPWLNLCHHRALHS